MKKSKAGCEHKNCFLCRFCLPEWIPAIEANKKTFNYKKGELIFEEGEVVKGIYFVYDGTVKIHKKWGKEKELIIKALKKHRGKRKDASSDLGISERTLYRKIKEYDIAE